MFNGNEAGRGSRESRGQTTLDFALGVSIFLAVVLFTFIFIPGILSPFTGSTQEETVSTNRVADHLTKGMLGSPRRPYAIDDYCTVQFFANESATRCTFDDQTPIERQFGFDPARQHVNVTVYGNATTTARSDELLCWDGDTERLVDAATNCDSSDTVLARGDSPPADDSPSVTAHRVVFFAGQDVTVYVTMW